jgi:hypothetical protein
MYILPFSNHASGLPAPSHPAAGTTYGRGLAAIHVNEVHD